MMKYLFVFVLLIVFNSAANAQLNLVPNPSFEDTVYCPFGTNQIDACQHWLNFGNSPDYFNACTPFYGVPNQSFGFQYAHSGNAMAGVGLYRRPNAPSGPNYREFIGISLSQPLTIGQKYYFSCYTNFSGQLPVAIACNKFGVNFYTNSFDSCCPPPINNIAKIYTDSILSDTINWFKLSGSFVADSAYTHLCIGNFFDDNNTDTLRIGSIPDYSYYYIDDVCVTTDSLFNQTWTSLQIHEFGLTFKFWPNPTHGSFYVNHCLDEDQVFITDLLGRKVDFRSDCLSPKMKLITPMGIDKITMLLITITQPNYSSLSFKILLQP